METFERKGHEGVKFFVGPEVEKTPAADKRTLFVVGLQDTAVVEGLARTYKTPHIFLSANRSFDSVEEVEPGVYMVGKTMVSDWEKQIHYLLDKGFMVSLDYPAHKHALVLKALNAGIWQSRNFVPILSVAIPNVSNSSVNLTIKIDDSNFKATNDGVWCMNHHEITDSNRFTSWQEYSDDMIITEAEIAKHTPTITPGPTGWTGPLEVKTPEVKKNVGQLGGDDAFMGSLESREQDALKDPDMMEEFSESKNDGSLGLDPSPTTSLKPDTSVEETVKVPDVIDAVTAADAYAEGATEDPLSKEASKKTTKAKK